MRLHNLNLEFYQTFAESFSETRGRVQPGVQKAIKTLAKGEDILDIGCGNGNLERALSQSGHRGKYVGIDSSPALLQVAESASQHPQSAFYLRDLLEPDWAQDLGDSYWAITAFAILHHIPGTQLRVRLLKTIHSLLESGGQLTLSVWNFLTSSRLRSRIVPWETVQLSEKDLDPGDYLLDWRRGGYGLRYVHAFDENSLLNLAEKTGFEHVETYYSDGEGSRLGLYQIWESGG